MSAHRPKIEHLDRFVDLMNRAGVHRTAIESFAFHFERVAGGASNWMAECDIEALESLPESDRFEAYRKSGDQALLRTVVIKLNGGLGTGMGLESAKSLLEVRSGLTFLDLIARQTLATRQRTGAAIPLILMNSARTVEPSRRALSAYPELANADVPDGFLQNRVPKVFAMDLTPAEHPDDDLAWCPPGHGDLYTAIAGTGLLARLLDRGFEYAFVSNADNVGAVLDSGIAGFMVEHGHDLVMEAATRTAADRKGGHLCRLADGRLALRESAQCPPADRTAFQDITRHRFFNTNNLWLHLSAVAEALEAHHGYLPLATIVNRKPLDPRDPGSSPVLQLETAMGSAISLFENAAAVRVPRNRFSPVKNTNDLLAVRSDAYELTDDWRVALQPGREGPPLIRLDDEFFKMIDDFEPRFPAGPPSLRHCERLTVEGDVTFGRGVVVDGVATIRARRPAAVPDDSIVSGEIDL